MEGGPIPKFWPGFLCTPTWSVWGYLLSRGFGFGPLPAKLRFLLVLHS